MGNSFKKAYLKHGNLHFEQKLCFIFSLLTLFLALLFLLAAYLSYKFPSPNPRYTHNFEIGLVASAICVIFFLFFIIKRIILKKKINEIVTGEKVTTATVVGSVIEKTSEVLLIFPGYAKIVVASLWNVKEHPSYKDGDKVEMMLHPKDRKKFIFKTTYNKYYSC